MLLTGVMGLFIMSCKTQKPANVVQKKFPAFLKEGHRGTRGLMPENTIPAMRKAIDLGANVLEVDVHISQDKQVVVAHDPYLNHTFTLTPDGSEISPADARKYLLYQMPYAQIRQYDVGSKYFPAYPKQQKIKTYIPLLGELIDSVESYTAAKKLPPIIYNIEIKANPQQDGVYQPEPATLVQMVMAVVQQKQLPAHRYYLQSFDIRQLQQAHAQYPEVVIGFLTDKKNTVEENLALIGFKPQIYSPHYKLVTAELVQKCQAAGMKCVPWTVNTLAEMQNLVQLGVDGIITDYPDLLNELK